MARSGDTGVRWQASAWLVVAVFVGCGGESKSRGDRGGDGDDTGGSETSGSGGSAAANGGSTAARGGSAAANGGAATSGGSFGGASSPRGGSGAVGPIEPPGPSFCGGEPCDPPFACCMATGECFHPENDGEAGCPTPEPDDDQQGRKACASSSQCGANEYCMLDGLLCLGTGHCQPIDNCGECSSDPSAPYDPCRVCACDGNTYPNFQTACRAGVNAIWGGTGCGETGMEGGAGASSIPMRTFTSCGHDGQCPAGDFCCAINSRCYREADRDVCIPPPPGTRIACRTTDHCGDNEYCRGEGCEGPGGCVYEGSGPGDCGVTLEPVCGCNGTTYTSAACADQEGIRIERTGECDAK